MAISAGPVFVAVLVALWVSSLSMVVAFEKEVKPNNYPNFEFHESPVQDSAQVKPHEFASQFSEESVVGELGNEDREDKPNNYPGFKFTATPGFGEVHGESAKESAHDQFAQQHHGHGQKSLYGASFYNGARDSYVFDAHRESRGAAAFESTPTSTESFYSTDVPVYRGSDTTNKYPSSYDLINARNQEKNNVKVGDAESKFSSSEVASFDSYKTADERAVVHSEGEGGSSRFYTPASDPDFAFRFAKPENTEDHVSTVFSHVSFDNSDATHGSTSPALAKKQTSLSTGGHGCANVYWAEHTKEWPSFFTINTQVAQAYGMKAGDVYGTTTLLQALYDNRSDGYSQLLSHGTAALMNSYAMANYGLRHDAVIDQFLSALSSRTAAGVQAQKFLNANHAYGPNECLN